MPTLSTEQIAAVPAANLDILFDLTNTILSTFQKVVELELQTMKSDLTETDEPTRMAFSANDPQQLLAVSESVDLLQRTGWASRPSQIDVNCTISPRPRKLNSRRSPRHNTKRTSARCKTSSTASRTALRLVRGRRVRLAIADGPDDHPIRNRIRAPRSCKRTTGWYTLRRSTAGSRSVVATREAHCATYRAWWSRRTFWAKSGGFDPKIHTDQ